MFSAAVRQMPPQNARKCIFRRWDHGKTGYLSLAVMMAATTEGERTAVNFEWAVECCDIV